MKRSIGPLTYTIRESADWLEVDYTGQVADVSIARRWMTALEEDLMRTKKCKILWDSRRAEGHPPEVREWIWSWLAKTEYLKVSAILVESSLLKVTANMSSIGSSVRLKSFHEHGDAAAWLLNQSVA